MQVIIFCYNIFGFLVELDACMQPVEVGFCKAAFLKFYYDAETGTCQEFYYGGCMGNLNRSTLSVNANKPACSPQVTNILWNKHFPPAWFLSSVDWCYSPTWSKIANEDT